MMNRIFTAATGIFYLAIGACFFVPALVKPVQPTLAVPESQVMFGYGNLFNHLPMNVPLAVLMLLIGVAGLGAAAGGFATSRAFNRGLFMLAMLLTIMGLIPFGVNRVWGLMPLYNWTIGLFLVTALCCLYPAFLDGPLMPAVNEPVFKQ